jgi:hypothetical protein
MNAFPLIEELLFHRGWPFPSRRTARASIQDQKNPLVEYYFVVEESAGQGEPRKIVKLSLRLRRIMPCLTLEVNSLL